MLGLLQADPGPAHGRGAGQIRSISRRGPATGQLQCARLERNCVTDMPEPRPLTTMMWRVHPDHGENAETGKEQDV